MKLQRRQSHFSEPGAGIFEFHLELFAGSGKGALLKLRAHYLPTHLTDSN